MQQSYSVSISKTYTFDAAHALSNLPYESKCKNLHGHTYSVTVDLVGEISIVAQPENITEDKFMLLDYNILDNIVKPIIESFDHAILLCKHTNKDLFNTLNNTKVIEMKYPPTAEMIAITIGENIVKQIREDYNDKNIHHVVITVQETPKTQATVSIIV